MLCVVLCVVYVVVVVVSACGEVWHAENPVCTFNTFPCVPAPRPHVGTHAGVVPAHTGTF